MTAFFFNSNVAYSIEGIDSYFSRTYFQTLHFLLVCSKLLIWDWLPRLWTCPIIWCPKIGLGQGRCQIIPTTFGYGHMDMRVLSPDAASFEVYDTILDSSTHEDPLYLGFICVVAV